MAASWADCSGGGWRRCTRQQMPGVCSLMYKNPSGAATQRLVRPQRFVICVRYTRTAFIKPPTPAAETL